MFSWFKKKVKQVENTSNVNGIGVARISQIKNIQEAAKQLSTQIEELNNRINNLPPIPDHSDFASKSQSNTFTGQENVFTRGIELRDTLKMGWGGLHARIAPEDGSTKELHFKHAIGTGKFNLNMDNNSKIINLVDPVDARDAVTKKYVDDKVGNGVVTLDTNQVITGNKSFTGDITANKIFASDNDMSEPRTVVNKRYLEGQLHNMVTTDTSQTITGAKTFANEMTNMKNLNLAGNLVALDTQASSLNVTNEVRVTNDIHARKLLLNSGEFSNPIQAVTKGYVETNFVSNNRLPKFQLYQSGTKDSNPSNTVRVGGTWLLDTIYEVFFVTDVGRGKGAIVYPGYYIIEDNLDATFVLGRQINANTPWKCYRRILGSQSNG